MMEMDESNSVAGAVKSFSIFMPYYENAGKAEQFMYHLRKVTVLHGTAMTGIRGF